MAIRLNESLRQQLMPPKASQPLPAREPTPPAKDYDDALAQAMVASSSADERLAKTLDETAERLAKLHNKPVRYRMTHTFKRDDNGRIISAETIVQPMDDA